MFRNIEDQFEIFDCLFTIESNDKMQHSRMKAPRVMLEQQFKSLVKQAVDITTPVKIKMSMFIPIYNRFEDNWINKENSIIFMNNAWMKEKPEQTEV